MSIAREGRREIVIATALFLVFSAAAAVPALLVSPWYWLILVPLSDLPPRKKSQRLIHFFDRKDLKAAFTTRAHHVFPQHEIPRIGSWNDHALRAGKAEVSARVEESLDLFGHRTNRLDVSQLVDGSRHGQILPKCSVRVA